MKAIKIIALAALITLLASCGNGKPANENQNDLTSQTENEQIASPLTDIYGTYQGVIPAANTAGIAMHLTINSDETFILTREYQDKKQGSFKDQGRFIFVNDRVIELTDKKGIKTYYRINNGSIILSDPEGNVADADFASRYQLKKI
ncbi:MAG: copper resistance protein NlpE [Petrimonas sp.]|jgi:uncharacterized lipoprotein NlpE involved in copper resistance|nr:copper resistance protein NlpE [Petrimonas sp.]HBC39051.1 hypothetical protein [Porphyromonadaceae bacterium]HMM18280.1 copper resistance protein NlpE [Petrimonas sp.]